MHYASDADVVFAYETYNAFEGAAALAASWGEKLMAFLNEPTEDGTVFEVDARLRPHGRNGLLVPSLLSCFEYFESEAKGLAVWERQAWTRARFVAGNPETASRLLMASRDAAFPEKWQDGWSAELRHVKNRVETERASKKSAGKGEIFDVKLGRGGLSDIEWCAQWLALQFGAKFPILQTPETRSQIEAAHEAGVLPHGEMKALLDAHTFLRRAELRLQITQAASSSSVARDTPQFRAWARAVFPDETTEVAEEMFEAQWREHTTAARSVFERVRAEL